MELANRDGDLLHSDVSDNDEDPPTELEVLVNESPLYHPVQSRSHNLPAPRCGWKCVISRAAYTLLGILLSTALFLIRRCDTVRTYIDRTQATTFEAIKCEFVRHNPTCRSFRANDSVRLYFDVFEEGRNFYGTPSFSPGSKCSTLFGHETGNDASSYDAILLNTPTRLDACYQGKQVPVSEACWDTIIVGYTLESTFVHPWFFNRYFWRSLDVIVSFEELSDVPGGEKIMVKGVATPALSLASYSPKSELASVVISASHGNSGREDYILGLEKAGLSIASYGHWHRNKEDFAYNRGDKRAVLAKHIFHLAFENSIDLSYVTEKVFEGLVAPSIPVYLGAPDARNYLPPNSTIFVADYPSPVQLVDYLKRVASDESLYKFHHAWREPAIFADWLDKFGRIHPSFSASAASMWDRLCDELVRRKRLLLLKTDPSYAG